MTRRPTRTRSEKRIVMDGTSVPINVKNDDTPIEVLAASIVDISKAAKSLLSSRLRHDTLIMLIAHSSKVSQKNVKAVLDSLTDLERRYLK